MVEACAISQSFEIIGSLHSITADDIKTKYGNIGQVKSTLYNVVTTSEKLADGNIYLVQIIDIDVAMQFSFVRFNSEITPEKMTSSCFLITSDKS